MFSDNLSVALLKAIEEKNLSQERLAAACHISNRQISNIIRKRSTAKITSVEKLCSALDLTPNDLLLPQEHNNNPAKEITEIIHDINYGSDEYKPVCPHCNKTLKFEYTAYCEHCSGKLSWHNYSKATIKEITLNGMHY